MHSRIFAAREISGRPADMLSFSLEPGQSSAFGAGEGADVSPLFPASDAGFYQALTSAVQSSYTPAASAGPSIGTSTPGSSIVVSSGGLTVNLIFDAAAMAAPASFRAGIQQAAAILASTFTDKITVNLNVDYSGTGGGASAKPDNGLFENYSWVRSNLTSHASAGSTTFNGLPNTTSIQGQSSVAVWNAELKLWGVVAANNTTTDDGSATFAIDIDPNLLVGVALHELTHAMGRVPYGSAPDIFDLFRFTGPGTRLFSGALTAPAAYFSIDGGHTKLADYGQSSDPSDFLNTGVQGSNDPFNEFYAGSTSQQLSWVDLKQLEALGFHLSSTPSAWVHSPIVLNDFDWAHGWGSVNNPRMLTDIDSGGQKDYLAFGSDYTLVADGGNWIAGGQVGDGFANVRAILHDFGTNEGYTADMQRGAVSTGYGAAETVYGQGFAGVYWYGATNSSPTYEITPHFYGQFGSQQGWTTHDGFQILKAWTSDSYASILGFGSDGVIVGPQAFAPGATASQSYLVSLGMGNNSGWDQQVDVRTFLDNKGQIVDLNKDGIADFVGMGPNGLAFAFGTEDASHHYGLGPLQVANLGAGTDLGRAQGWTDANTLRMVVHDSTSGYDDIIAFGASSVLVAMGQNPSTHGGQPFAPLHLAMADMGTNQGWSNALTPRLVGDVNGDGVPDVVGFGADHTFVAIGSRDASGNLNFAIDPSKTIADFGYHEGWDWTTLRTLGDIHGNGHDSLVVSGATGTHVWDLVA